jgi:hypothetical protein
MRVTCAPRASSVSPSSSRPASPRKMPPACRAIAASANSGRSSSASLSKRPPSGVTMRLTPKRAMARARWSPPSRRRRPGWGQARCAVIAPSAFSAAFGLTKMANHSHRCRAAASRGPGSARSKIASTGKRTGAAARLDQSRAACSPAPPAASRRCVSPPGLRFTHPSRAARISSAPRARNSSARDWPSASGVIRGASPRSSALAMRLPSGAATKPRRCSAPPSISQ